MLNQNFMWSEKVSTNADVNNKPIISPDLLEILICPACKGKVELKKDESGIKCLQCKRVYPIRDGIPGMIVEEAVVEDEDSPSNI